MGITRREFIALAASAVSAAGAAAKGTVVLEPYVVWVKQTDRTTESFVRLYLTEFAPGVDPNSPPMVALHQVGKLLPDPRIASRRHLASRQVDMGRKMTFEEALAAVNEDARYANSKMAEPLPLDRVLAPRATGPELESVR
jgi:hypothetical protein